MAATQCHSRFFMMPNGVFLEGLRPSCLSVLCYLQQCADRDSGTAFPSLRAIALACGVSRSTVQRSLETLAEKGLIEICHRRGEGGRCTTNVYRLLLWPQVNRGCTHSDTGAIPTVTPLLTRPIYNKTQRTKAPPLSPSRVEGGRGGGFWKSRGLGFGKQKRRSAFDGTPCSGNESNPQSRIPRRRC